MPVINRTEGRKGFEAFLETAHYSTLQILSINHARTDAVNPDARANRHDHSALTHLQELIQTDQFTRTDSIRATPCANLLIGDHREHNSSNP